MNITFTDNKIRKEEQTDNDNETVIKNVKDITYYKNLRVATGKKSGYIYCITDNTNGNIYFGSTIEKYVSNRIAGHKRGFKDYKRGKSYKGYCNSYKILENNDYSYHTIEKVYFDDKYELRNREKYFIQKYYCVNCEFNNKVFPKMKYEKFIETHCLIIELESKHKNGYLHPQNKRFNSL